MRIFIIREEAYVILNQEYYEKYGFRKGNAFYIFMEKIVGRIIQS